MSIESNISARQSPRPVDAPPSRGVPVEVCEPIAESPTDYSKEDSPTATIYVECTAGKWRRFLSAVEAAQRGEQPPQVRADDEAGAPKEVSPPPRTYSESDLQLAKAICDHVYRRSAGCNVAFTPIAEIISQFLASERAEAKKDTIGSAVGFSERIVSLERELAQARAELAAVSTELAEVRRERDGFGAIIRGEGKTEPGTPFNQSDVDYLLALSECERRSCTGKWFRDMAAKVCATLKELAAVREREGRTIRFTRTLPTVAGAYLHKVDGVTNLTTVKIDDQGMRYRSGEVWMTPGTETIGHWCGPLLEFDQAPPPQPPVDAPPAGPANGEGE